MTLTVTEPLDVQDFVDQLLAADNDTTLRLLRTATPAQALAAVQWMGLRALYELPRDIVESWPGNANTPGTARFVRTLRLTTESWVAGTAPEDLLKRLWRIADIARAANVKPNSVSRWRTNTNNGVDDINRCLPKEFATIGEKKPKNEQTRARKGGGTIPVWDPPGVLAWLKRTKKVTDDLYPHKRARGGGIPTGRPPKQRSAE